jgi:hypothetical protein
MLTANMQRNKQQFVHMMLPFWHLSRAGSRPRRDLHGGEAMTVLDFLCCQMDLSTDLAGLH